MDAQAAAGTGGGGVSDHPPEAVPTPDPNPMEVSAYLHAQALDRIAILEEQLRQMAIERSQLTTMAERTGAAEYEAHQLREAARIDSRIALFARMMHEVAKQPPQDNLTWRPDQILGLLRGRLNDLDHAHARQGGSPFVLPIAGAIGVWAMRYADSVIFREREALRRTVERREAELKAQAPPT